MVATRRQSGKLPQLPNLQEQPLEDESDGEFSTEPESEVDSLGDEGSDWEGGPSRYQKNGRPAKRAKTSHQQSAKSSRKTNGKKRKDLSLLPTMPLDILFEIFGQLSPKDLVKLAKVNKSFRATLTSRNAASVWKAARDQFSAPECPPDVAEMRWAALLFGGTNCQECGTTGIQSIEFSLRRRVCVACRKKNLVVASRFPAVFPDYERSMLAYIPYTNIGGWAHGHASGSKFYWKSDITDFAEKLGALQKKVQLRMIGARQELDQFLAGRLELVENVAKHATSCYEWIKIRNADQYHARSAARTRRVTEINNRLKALGYSQNDLDLVRYHDVVNRDKDLTERGWKKLLPVLEQSIITKKTEKLEREKARRILDRTHLVKQLYTRYKQSLSPSQWPYMPPVCDIIASPQFRNLIDDPTEALLAAPNFAGPVASLPTLVTEMSEVRKEELRSMLTSLSQTPPQGSTEQTPKCPNTLSPGEIPDEPQFVGAPPTSHDALDLAIAVFECPSRFCRQDANQGGYNRGHPLIGWEGAVTHSCMPAHAYNYGLPETPILHESLVGLDTVKALLKIAGLDPLTTTAAEMDRRGLRFFCAECPSRMHSNTIGRAAYTWRSAVAHRLCNVLPHSNKWQLLTSAENQLLKFVGEQYPQRDAPLWVCNHCTDFCQWPRHYPIIADHVKTRHGIADPSAPEDIFNMPGVYPKTNDIAIVPSQEQKKTSASPAQIHKCLHCSPQSKRLFQRDGVISHIKAKHAILNPMASTDFA